MTVLSYLLVLNIPQQLYSGNDDDDDDDDDYNKSDTLPKASKLINGEAKF